MPSGACLDWWYDAFGLEGPWAGAEGADRGEPPQVSVEQLQEGFSFGAGPVDFTCDLAAWAAGRRREVDRITHIQIPRCPTLPHRLG